MTKNRRLTCTTAVPPAMTRRGRYDIETANAPKVPDEGGAPLFSGGTGGTGGTARKSQGFSCPTAVPPGRCRWDTYLTSIISESNGVTPGTPHFEHRPRSIPESDACFHRKIKKRRRDNALAAPIAWVAG